MDKKKKKEKKRKYETRRDMMLKQLPEPLLEMMFKGNEQKMKEYGDYLVKFDEMEDNLIDEEILSSGESLYSKKIKKLRKKQKKAKTSDKFLMLEKEIKRLKKKEKKNEKYSISKLQSDLSIASYTNDKRFKKKFMDKKKYRKTLKKIAKAEKRERKEAIDLGYIHSKDVDKKLESLKLTDVNQKMITALSDTYIQKHFIS